MTEPRTLPDLINQLCTQPEKQAIEYAFAKRLGIRRAARHPNINISLSAFRARLENARRKLNRAGATAANPDGLEPFADWIRQRNQRDILPDEPAPSSPTVTSADAQLYDMGRTDHALRGIPLAGSGPGATHIQLGRLTITSRPDHAIERLIA